MNKRVRALAVIRVGFALILAAAAPVHAGLIITPTFESSITSDPNASSIETAINAAIGVYETTFSDPVNVAIQFAEMTTGLGASSTAFGNISYSLFLSQLQAHATTANDFIALSHLPAGPNNPVNGNATINVKSANLKALGFSVNLQGQPDGIISLNTSLTTPGSPGTTSQYDLITVVEHEIDEVLGLGSALPSPPNNTIFPEDLFRYDASGQRSFTTDSAALVYFSLDGTTRLAQFNNQNNGGDFGDWQSSPRPSGVSPEVQDAFATPGAQPGLGVELTALDAIGFDLATPEPATVGLLCVGLLILGFIKLRVRWLLLKLHKAKY